MSFGLRPRPEIPAEELAIITAAAQALLSPAATEEIQDATPAYRFSGRWWSATRRALR